MVNDPRSPKPRSSGPQEPRDPQDPQDPLDLLRELARNRAPASPDEQDAPGHPGPGDEKLDSLRALAETLNRQLRSPPGTTPESFQGPHQYPSHDPLPPRPAAPPPEPQNAWLRAAQFEWAAFYDGLPPARALVPRLRVPEIVFVAIAGVVLAAAALGTYVHHRGALAPNTNERSNEHTNERTNERVTPAPATAAPPGETPFAPEPQPTVADVKKAMSDCDAAAAHDPDSLYFLILPLLRTDVGVTSSWNPVPLQTIGTTYLLLGANDALDGLRDSKLKVRPGRYTFSVLDSLSGATYSWTSATGMIRLARKDTGGMKTLKLGFDFSPTQVGAQWSAEFKRDRGACYWVSVLVQ